MENNKAYWIYGIVQICLILLKLFGCLKKVRWCWILAPTLIPFLIALVVAIIIIIKEYINLK